MGLDAGVTVDVCGLRDAICISGGVWMGDVVGVTAVEKAAGMEGTAGTA